MRHYLIDEQKLSGSCAEAQDNPFIIVIIQHLLELLMIQSDKLAYLTDLSGSRGRTSGETALSCFLVSAAEAVVATAIEKAEEKKELKMAETNTEITEEVTIPWSRKLKWLTYMLWGGAVLLAFEHIWHGEVVPWFPFLTAMSDPADAAEMFHEMATVGVAMAGLITVVWIAMCIAASAIAKRPAEAPKQKTAI